MTASAREGVHVLGRGAHRAGELALAAAIFAGSLVLWVGLPVGWLWVVSHLSTEYPNVWAAAVFGAPVTMAAWGYGLARLNAVYLRVSGSGPQQQHSAWLKSLSGERSRQRPRRGVLETSMAISVILAMLTLLVWFFFYAENYSPGRVL